MSNILESFCLGCGNQFPSLALTADKLKGIKENVAVTFRHPKFIENQLKASGIEGFKHDDAPGPQQSIELLVTFLTCAQRRMSEPVANIMPDSFELGSKIFSFTRHVARHAGMWKPPSKASFKL